MRKTLAALCGLAVLTLAACGGGGSAGGAIAPIPGGFTQSNQKLGVTFGGGSIPLSTARRTQSVGGTPVTVTYNGTVVATGTLDSNGFAELDFTAAVPAGATVTVTAGTAPNAVVVTVVLATAISATSADAVYQPATGSSPATITVTSAADQNGDGKVDANDPNQVTETENPGDGQPENVDSSDDNVLPSNLPITISTCNGQTITVAPAPGQPTLALNFEEKVSDSDTGSNFEYNANPFSAPLTFPISSSAARIDIEVDNASTGQKIVSIEAPITAFTGSSGGASPSPSPSACPTLSPVQQPSPQPTSSAS